MGALPDALGALGMARCPLSLPKHLNMLPVRPDAYFFSVCVLCPICPPLKKSEGVEIGVEMKKRPGGRMFIGSLAEEAGFEPAVGLTPRTLSRRVT